MSKEEGFYVQETHSYINVLGRIGISACSVEVVPTLPLGAVKLTSLLRHASQYPDSHFSYLEPGSLPTSTLLCRRSAS